MDENDVRIGTECMRDISEVLKRHGCGLDIRVTFSSVHGPSFQIVAFPTRNIVVANKIPNLGDN